jgi:hypothetical protein
MRNDLSHGLVIKGTDCGTSQAGHDEGTNCGGSMYARCLAIALFILLPALSASGDRSDGAASARGRAATVALDSGLVTICHVKSQTPNTLQVAISAVPAHLAHGDFLGPCL